MLYLEEALQQLPAGLISIFWFPINSLASSIEHLGPCRINKFE